LVEQGCTQIFSGDLNFFSRKIFKQKNNFPVKKFHINGPIRGIWVHPCNFCLPRIFVKRAQIFLRSYGTWMIFRWGRVRTTSATHVVTSDFNNFGLCLLGGEEVKTTWIIHLATHLTRVIAAMGDMKMFTLIFIILAINCWNEFELSGMLAHISPLLLWNLLCESFFL